MFEYESVIAHYRQLDVFMSFKMHKFTADYFIIILNKNSCDFLVTLTMKK